MQPSAKCALLEQNTEVVVAPKLRPGMQGGKQSNSALPVATQPLKDSAEKKKAESVEMSDHNVESESFNPLVKEKDTAGANFVHEIPPLRSSTPVQNENMASSNVEVNDFGKEIGVDPLAGQNQEDRQETERGQSMIYQAVSYLKSWFGKSSESGENQKAQEQKETRYSKEYLKLRFDDCLRIQSLGYVCDVEIDQSNDSHEMRSADVALNQPTNVFITRQTFVNSFRKSRGCAREVLDLAPMSFLASLVKVLSPVEKEEAMKNKTGSQAQRTKGTAKEQNQQYSNTTGDSDLEQMPLTCVRVIVVDSNNCVQLQNHAGGKQRLEKLSDGHVGLCELLRRQLGLDLTGRVKLQSLPEDVKERTFSDITFYPLFKAVSLQEEEESQYFHSDMVF